MTKLRLTWLGIALGVLAIGCVTGAFLGGPTAGRIGSGALGAIAASMAWRCWVMAARRPNTPGAPAGRPWDR